jgi:hypothetical protein
LIFDAKVGAGRMLVRYAGSDAFMPQTDIDREAIAKLLATKLQVKESITKEER